MVTTRRRRAPLALPLLESRIDSLESNASTAGPFTLNKTDPKVSVSAARVDRAGLHVSLTIPLESSVTSRPAMNHKSKPVRREIGRLEMSSPVPSFQNGAETDKVTLPSPNYYKAMRMPNQANPKSTNKQARQGSVRKNGSPPVRRLPSAGQREESIPGTLATSMGLYEPRAPLKNPVRALRMPRNTPEAFENSDVEVRPSTSEPCSGHNKRGKRLQASPVAMAPAMQPTEGDNAGRTFQRLPQSTQQVAHSVKVNESMAFKCARKQSYPRMSKLFRGCICKRRSRSTAGFFPAHAREHNTPPASTATTSHLWLLDAFMNFFSFERILHPYRWRAPAVSCAVLIKGAPVAARLAAYAFLGVSCMALLFWGDVNPLTASFWSGLHRIGFPARSSQDEWQAATGTFALAEASEIQRQCVKLGSLCSGGKEILCGYPVDLPPNGCVTLGLDIAAKEAGGSVNYAQTSGAVSHMALVLSQLLQNVASFAMPNLGYGASWNSLASNAASKFLQSYYPLYNHTNDPGVLVSDSSAIYVIQDKHGQVTIDLGRPSPVFAVGMETPGTADPEGRCESAEMRWFSVYVQLQGKEEAFCRTSAPSGDTFVEFHGGEERWCQVGRFEKQCKVKPALQVFCLDIPSGEPQELPHWASQGTMACRTTRGWQTQRVRIVLNGNWGAGATRIRRLRVFSLL